MKDQCEVKRCKARGPNAPIKERITVAKACGEKRLQARKALLQQGAHELVQHD